MSKYHIVGNLMSRLKYRFCEMSVLLCYLLYHTQDRPGRDQDIPFDWNICEDVKRRSRVLSSWVGIVATEYIENTR